MSESYVLTLKGKQFDEVSRLLENDGYVNTEYNFSKDKTVGTAHYDCIVKRKGHADSVDVQYYFKKVGKHNYRADTVFNTESY